MKKLFFSSASTKGLQLIGNTLLAIALVLALATCKSATSSSSSSDETETVTIASQSGTLTAGTAGTVLFAVTTANISNGTVGTIAWYTSSSGTTVGSRPTGIIALVSAVTSNSATVTIPPTVSAAAGSYYFKLTEDSAVSGVAILTVSAAEKYSITYNSNGASGSVPTDSTTYTQGTTATVSTSSGSLNYSGCALAGWMTKQDGTGTSYAAGATFSMGTANVILYAVWVPTSLTFSSSGTSITISGTTSKSIVSAIIPPGVTCIGNGAFDNCSSLTGVSIPSSVTSINMDAFCRCSALTSVSIPSGVTYIYEDAFESCSALTSVNIPSGVIYIGGLAFGDCTALTSVSIPSSVTYIYEDAFESCDTLTSISVAAGNPDYTSDSSGVLFNKTKTTLLEAPGGITGSYNIPSSVFSIGARAFLYCRKLTSVSIPSSVTSIGDSAFDNCYTLTSVMMGGSTPPSLPTAALDVFSDAASGFKIHIPNNATAIANYAAATGWSLYSSEIVTP